MKLSRPAQSCHWAGETLSNHSTPEPLIKAPWAGSGSPNNARFSPVASTTNRLVTLAVRPPLPRSSV